MEKDLCERLFKFSLSVIKFLKTITNTPEIKVLKYQLTKSSTSGGANYEEAQAASSRSDFKNKVNISLREMRESNYLLRLFKAIEVGGQQKTTYLVNEFEELKKILGSISSKIRK